MESRVRIRPIGIAPLRLSRRQIRLRVDGIATHTNSSQYPTFLDPIVDRIMASVPAMQLAKKAGINAAATRLVDSDGVPVTLVRRFDRTADGRRLMYVSAATLLGVERDAPQEHFYTEIVDALRLHGAAVQADIEELWRRITFPILITNVDDHLHNHGVLHADRGLGDWPRLSISIPFQIGSGS